MAGRVRPVIVALDYPDVFEDFYVHYGIDQERFANEWGKTGTHRFTSLIQDKVGDVIWYALSLEPTAEEAVNQSTGNRVRFLRSSFIHGRLWAWFYASPRSWRRQRWRRAYETVASYTAPSSLDVFRALRKDRPDAIFVQDYATGRFDVSFMAARWLKVPLIAYHSGSVAENYVGKRIRRWTLKRAALLLVSGPREAQMLQEKFGVSPDRATVLLTPIDTDAYRPIPRPEALFRCGIDGTRRFVLFVGRLDKVKRVDALIRQFAEAAGEHPEHDLVIVGEGPQGDELRSLAGELLPGRVHFRGWVAGDEDLAPYYSACDCLVLPSSVEGFPTVVGEAMACGAPVIATDVGGVGEMVVDEETGWLIPPGDDDALRRRLSVVMDGGDLSTLRAAARERAEERLSNEMVGRRLIEAFAEAGVHA